ncbi:transposase [soil metagenome]
MTELFRNTYRVSSARLKNYNYGNKGAYFITICSKDHKNFFGKIIPKNSDIPDKHGMKNDVELTNIGKIVRSEWIKSSLIRSDMNLEFDAYIIMPNHFHGTIIIGENSYNKAGESKKSNTDNFISAFKPQAKNLASVIRGFKSSVTSASKKLGYSGFAWQPGYYDHIIRNYEDFQKIHEYIITNPENWKKDKFYIDSGDSMLASQDIWVL